MSAVRDYLTEKAALGGREWLRREPRQTHPEILALVRAALGAGLSYDDDVERYVNEQAGDLPAHERHGTDGRDPLVTQLGHEVYLARGLLKDEAAAAAITAAQADGFALLGDATLVDGARCEIRCGTVYVGRAVAEYGPARPVRLEFSGDRWAFVEKCKRTRYRLPEHCLIRPGWARKEATPKETIAAAL